MASSPKNKTVSSARDKNKSALVNPENTTAQSYQEIIETVGVVIWRAPVNSFQYTYINPEAEKLFGYPVEECLEEGFWESIIHPEDRDWVKEYCTLALREKQSYQLDYRIVTKNGQIKTVRAIVRLSFRKGKVHEQVGILTDVSIQSQTVEELQKSNQKFYRAFHNFPIPASISRMRDGCLLDVNKNFVIVSGYERSQLVGKSSFSLGAWLKPEEREQIIRLVTNNERVDKFPVLMKDAFDRERNMLISAELFEYEGEPCLLFMFYDITERIKTEEQLQLANRELETFMYKSSHNLKGPVASIRGLLHLAQREVQDEKAREYFELMNRSAQGLENTLEELLDVTRLKQGNIKSESIDLRHMLDEINSKLKFMREWANINFQAHISQSETFFTDPHLLYSILQNLIENAAKYKDDSKEPRIDVYIHLGAHMLEVRVEDNGVGIPPELQERVFEMFYRAHTMATGTGLGLYIVRNATQKLGGTINVKSEKNKGSVFSLSLPNLKGQE
jgi:PAS domain S-box-containing protein